MIVIVIRTVSVYRRTFSVELLLAGVPIERVSILLGHQSVRITEKHYAPWVRARQEQWLHGADQDLQVPNRWNSKKVPAYKGPLR
jgi:integrase